LDGGDGLYVLLNNQLGGFMQGVFAVTLADLNGDGNLDAMVLPGTDGEGLVYLGSEFTIANLAGIVILAVPARLGL
jgi:hypothetical protein